MPLAKIYDLIVLKLINFNLDEAGRTGSEGIQGPIGNQVKTFFSLVI
jgi:hypothetical protein